MAETQASHETTRETAQPPHPWMRLIAGAVLILAVGMGLVLLIQQVLPQRQPANPGAEATWDNPNIAGRFVNDAKQLKARLDRTEKELAQLQEHREQLAAAIKQMPEAETKIANLLTAILSDVETRVDYLAAERDELEETLASRKKNQ